ncbi:hypothetical protein GO730_01485 [Spirosoma sp. HMF3257]|uniref:Uncharacterized protein n=1 Tax=Spirosoma telluris TaxID=2183553 RepID=A0A327NHM7_9BACT|nr:hypothetical protein [Spirosoma telluris]RAI73434.1 hypothetical protein HMF3257_01455 [Spirosoma telluris]
MFFIRVVSGLSEPLVAQQLFPVNATVLVYPPYPVYLTDYANTFNNSFQLQLLLRDIELGSRQVTLKIQLNQQGGNSIQSRYPAVGVPVTELVSGVPVILRQADLAPYFQPQNLNLSPNAYSQPLTEGIYTMSVTVYDLLTGKQLSAVQSSAPFWVVISDPPLLNLPENNGFVVEQTPQNLLFQWTPRTKQATSVEYDFTLTELIGVNGFSGNLQNLFLAQPPYFTTTTPTTSFLYGPAYPPLIRGRIYGYRVRARAKRGLEEIGIFRNDGYSEIRFFMYGYENQAPFNESADWNTTLDLSWEDNILHDNFLIRYREKGTLTWLERKIAGQQAKYGATYRLSMPDLLNTKTYEYQIGGISMQNSNNIAYTVIRTINPIYKIEQVTTVTKVQVPENVVTTTYQLVCTTKRIGFFPITICSMQPVTTTTVVYKTVDKVVVTEVKKPIVETDDGTITPIDLDGSNHNDILSDDSTAVATVSKKHPYATPTCANPAVNIDMSTEGKITAGDTIHVAGYDIIALGNNKGMVFVDMPFVSKKVAFALNFKDVKVNEFMELKAGSMETTFNNAKYQASITQAQVAKGASQTANATAKQELKKDNVLPLEAIKAIDLLTKTADDMTITIRNQFLNNADVAAIKKNIISLKATLSDKSAKIQLVVTDMTKNADKFKLLTDNDSQLKVTYLTDQIQVMTSQKTKTDAQFVKIDNFMKQDRYWTNTQGFLKNGPILFGAQAVAAK